MAAEPAPWRQVFDTLERGVGAPLERSLNTSRSRAVLTRATRARRSVTQLVEQATATGLHVIGLPAATDLRALSRTIASLERQVRDLADELEDRRIDGGRDQR